MSTARQRQLRLNATPPERATWKLLKGFRKRSYHFRRQVALGPCYAVFASHGDRLVIEVDGDSHAHQVAHDARRDAYLRARGFEVVRVSILDVLHNPEGVHHLIEEALSASTPTPGPSPQEGGKEPAAAPVAGSEDGDS